MKTNTPVYVYLLAKQSRLKITKGTIKAKTYNAKTITQAQKAAIKAKKKKGNSAEEQTR